MLEVDSPRDLIAHIGKPLDPSEWLTVDQAMIDAFADATGDHQWIHVDPERAKREMPGGKTIAHGFLTLSLLPRLAKSIFNVRGRSRTLNYGSNKVRFTATVPSGSRIRLRVTLKSAEPVEGGIRLIFDNTIEVEGHEKPALVAETIQVTYL
jgi:acyl dehydratase